MPIIATKRMGVVLDMHGCPNRCRHCYLGFGTNQKMSDDDLRWMAAKFRDYMETSDAIESLTIASDFREPDFSDRYRQLYELEKALGDEEPARYELLSIWRLARDKEYARWAKSVGPDTCQIHLFGMGKTNDWFYQRKGAFRDALIATERLLDTGMKPRWEIVLTRKLIPEIDELLRLIKSLRLRERIQELGSEFQLFLHTPDPIGEGRRIEHLRPTIEEVISLPEEILEASRRHFGRQTLWQTEGELYKSIMEKEETPPLDETLLDEPERFWFFVANNWDVFSNVGTLEPWWKLGNLKLDSVDTIMKRFQRDEILGLDVLMHYPQSKLAQEYGDPQGRKIYSDRGELLDLYREEHCEATWKSRRAYPCK